MNSIEWHMANCACVIKYDYTPVDSVENRFNHDFVSRCEYHQAFEGKELHDVLLDEQIAVYNASIAIASIKPELLITDEKTQTSKLDESKVSFAFDEKRDLEVSISTLSEFEKGSLTTDLKSSITDREVIVI